MPIYKYKSLEDAEKDMVNFFPDHVYFEQSGILWDIVDKLSPISCRKGVFKFRSIEQANRHREEWELANAIKLRMNREDAATDF